MLSMHQRDKETPGIVLGGFKQARKLVQFSGEKAKGGCSGNDVSLERVPISLRNHATFLVFEINAAEFIKKRLEPTYYFQMNYSYYYRITIMAEKKNHQVAQTYFV